MRVTVNSSEGQNILAWLRDNDIYLPAICGGRGTCGKCGVKVYGREEALACQTEAEDGMVIEVPDENDFQILETYSPRLTEPQSEAVDGSLRTGLGVVVDIGTATLAFELLDLKTGKRIAAHSAVNRQRIFGADVISRTSYAVNGRQDELHRYIIEDIRFGIENVTKKYLKDIRHGAGNSKPVINSVAISGNTAMLHLLRNYPCGTLGVYPFTPVSVAAEKHRCGCCEITILPGISAFVGADVTAGIIFCGEPSGGGYDLLIDLGTNCEMALYNKNSIFVTSAAAGPAFEGGNISCGAGSVPGAVAKVTYLPNRRVYAYETINNKPPIGGICGTGVIDAAAQLALNGVIDETGLMRGEFFESGVTLAPGVVFTQKDVREIQLAKSAVRSGIEILLAEAGISGAAVSDYGSVRRVLLAGGFGHKIDIENACVLGIIPRELKSRVIAVGNSSLGGAARVLLSSEAGRKAENAAARAKEINLSTHPLFNKFFMANMGFQAIRQ